MSELRDEDIAKKVQNGDTESFGLLVERYEQKMMRYARKFLFGRHDAEDLVQEVFLKAYINIQGFDIKRKFSSWLYRIAHNEFINAIKKKRRLPFISFDIDTLFSHLASEETADREMNEKDLKEMLDSCLNKLDFKYREPLILYYYEEMNYQEIAEVMRIPVSTVGIRLKRGREILKKTFGKQDNLYE